VCGSGGEAAEVEAARQRGGDGNFLAHGVGKAGCDGFVGAVPVVGAFEQGGEHFRGAEAGLGGVASGQRGGVAVEHVGLIAQLGGVAHGDAPRRVDHHLRVGGHGDAVTGHCDVAGATDGDAVHMHGHRGRVALERVVDGQAVHHAAAEAVDAQGDRVSIERGDVAHEGGGDHVAFVPGVADVAVNEDFGGLAFSGLGCSLDLIPRRGGGFAHAGSG